VIAITKNLFETTSRYPSICVKLNAGLLGNCTTETAHSAMWSPRPALDRCNYLYSLKLSLYRPI